MYRKRILSIFLAVVLVLSLSTSVFAATLTGTWYPGVAPNDPIPAFNGYVTDSNGNTQTLTTSPFNGHNIITKEQLKKSNDNRNKGNITPNDWWSGDYYYEYISNSYTQTSSTDDPYHFNVGHTQAYNGTPSPATLSYQQQQSYTSNWSVTAQVSATAELKTDYLAKLGATFGGSYTSSNTTSSSTSILYSIQVPSMQTGYIYAWLPGGYSYGTAQYTEYYYDIYSGYFFRTGNIVTTNEGGWAPLSNSSVYVLNFTSYTS
ncbi:MAG: hypothetical protein ACYCVD_18255 [Desulfitobacteriaceae bacterium]